MKRKSLMHKPPPPTPDRCLYAICKIKAISEYLVNLFTAAFDLEWYKTVKLCYVWTVCMNCKAETMADK